MGKIIFFSGPCHAGKTTMMESVARDISAPFIMRKEPIRDLLPAHASIDRVRRDPLAYLDLQEKQWAIRKNTIMSALADEEDTVTLIDRSPADSLFYTLAYMIPEPWWFDPEEVSDYRARRSAIVSDIYRFYEDVIDGNPDIMCLFFNQIDPSNNNDPMRPKAILDTQDMEQWGIRALSDGFFSRSENYHIITVTSESSRKECYDAIIKFTEDCK